MMLKAVVRTSTIATFNLLPPSCSFFEESIDSNQQNSTLRLLDSHTRGQQATQTNGGGNQRGKTCNNPPRNNDTPRPRLQNDTGWLCFPKSNAGGSRVPRLGNGTYLCKKFVIIGHACSNNGTSGNGGHHLRHRDRTAVDKLIIDE